MTTLESIANKTYEAGEKHAYWMARMKLIELDHQQMVEWLKEQSDEPYVMDATDDIIIAKG